MKLFADALALPLAVSGALVLALPSAGAAQESPGLQRVAPVEDAAIDDGRGLAPLLAKEFRRDEWLARLSVADLDRRERSFEVLLERARLDPLARAFLEELARDATAGELAWTARLALRELGHVAFPLHAFPPHVVPGVPGSDPLRRQARAARALGELLARGVLQPEARAGEAAQGGARWVHVEQGADGARVRIRERGGELSFEGPSLEEIVRTNPEVARALAGLELRTEGPGLDLRFALGADAGLAPTPRGRSRPIVEDKLGVIVQPLAPARASELGVGGRGLLVARVYPETFAQLLGVGVGSVLLELDGVALAQPEDIERAMHSRRSDAPLRLVWLDALGQRMERTWSAPKAR